MSEHQIKIDAKLQAYTKGIFPTFPQPTQFDIGKVLGVDEQGKYALIEQPITKEQVQQIIEKLDTIEPGAQENKIEIISINGQALPITGKQIDIPIANSSRCGVVKSSSLENYVQVHQDGQMEVNTINIEKITQRPGQDIVLDCKL